MAEGPVTRRTYQRALFAAAAAWNLGAAATLIFHPESLLARLGVADPAARLLAQSLASSAAAWGIGYALVALNPRRFRDLAALGALSKSLFAAVYAAAFCSGQLPFAAFAPALIDFVFAALFAESLWRTRGEGTTDGHR